VRLLRAAALVTFLAASAAIARAVVHRTAIREAEGATRITPGNVGSILAVAVDRDADDKDAAWIADRLGSHAESVLAKKGAAADLESLLLATASPSDLPPKDLAPLARLRGRIEGRTSIPLLDSGSRADALAKLHDARIVTRGPDDLVASFDRALALWAGALALAGLFIIGACNRASRSPDLAVVALSSFGALTVLGMTLLAIAVGALSGPLAAERVSEHVLAGAVASACVITGAPLLVRAARRVGAEEFFADGRAALTAAALLLVALSVAGHGPRGSAARINLMTPLGVFQPLEIAKLLLTVALAQHVGRHRASFAILSEERTAFMPWLSTLLLPFAVALVALIGSAWGLGDFGTVLVLAPTVALIIIAASGSGLVAALITAGALAAVPLLVFLPWPADSKVFVRLMSWLVPDANGLPGGDQLALAEQAIAGGGWFGSPWPTIPNVVPAGTTDLPVALLIERFGVVALVAFVIADLMLVFSGIAIGARLSNRRGEIRCVPMALAFLIAVQTLVALAGLAGLIPLSGIVTPFLSEGGTAMVVFSVASLAIARYGAVPGGAPEPGDDPLPRGLSIGFLAIGAGLVIALILLARHAAGDPHRLSDAIPTELADGRIAPRWSAVLRRAMAGIEPIPIVDRKGRAIAHGRREYPYGAALAPLTGIARRGISPLPGTLEAEARAKLARFPLRATAGDLVEACEGACSPVGLIPREGLFRATLLERIKKKHPGGDLRIHPFLAPDFGALARPLRDGPGALAEALERIRADVPSARTTIDADLQADVYTTLVEAMRAAKATAGAIVLRDAETGEVLVRVSGASPDPMRIDARAYAEPAITGAFGSLRDVAGRTAVPPGSTFKPITALALLARGEELHPEACVHHARRGRRGMQGNLHIRDKDASGWITDFGIDRPHGALDLEGAIEESCNVWFAQAGLAIGVDRMRELVSRIEVASFDVGVRGGIDLAAAAIGQGRTTMTADQVSLAYAAIAHDGATRSCSLMYGRDGALACKEVELGSKENAVRIQRALRNVVTSPRGTGTRAREPKGASFLVYGKTGTAEQDLLRGEKTGSAGSRRSAGRDHAWFAGFIEGASGKRYAFAILLARGGTGGRAAAPLAPKLGALLEKHGYFDVVAAR
jgi:cell division protein FtsW (lipid II flippase)